MAPSPDARRGRFRRRVAPLAAAVLLVAVAPAPAARADAAVAGTETVPGIDVSQWQGAIDWPRVAATRTRFVIARATRGVAFVDPTYATNLEGATDAGLAVGAYHRATPSGAHGDAVAEADHFLSVARNAAGDVVPVLDIEETGGLSVAALTDWVRAWVRRVHARLGVRPMLYASPYFWRTNLGDTTWFAERGYPLWIAHWNVPAPDVPAAGWAGHGWTYWQWTSTGTVAGVPEVVDRDRFAGADLMRGVIASLTVTPPDGGAIEGPRVACGDGGVRCDRLANPGAVVPLTATPAPGLALLRWTGACAPAASSPTCDVTALGEVAVGAVFGVPVQEDGEGASSAWARGRDPRALGGSFRWERRAGAAATYAFDGGTVTLRTVEGPAFGRARVLVDGVPVATIDGYARAFGVEARRLEDLAPGPHELEIVALGSARPAASDARVGVDALRWGGRLRANPGPSRETWAPAADVDASGGAFVRSDAPGATATLRFDGTGVDWLTFRGPGMGVAEVRVDGEVVRTVDLRRDERRPVRLRIASGLASGPHVVRVRVLALDRGRGVVAVDGWIVR
ncbi:MAG TPA: GH25 family lysozyme [Actinomycetota bacterium]